MKHRTQHRLHRAQDELNRGDYRGDFGLEGYERFAGAADRNHREHHEGHHGRRRHGRGAILERDDRREAGPWRWRRFGREGWQRGRTSGGYGSQFDAWSAGLGYRPAGFGFGPDEIPESAADADVDWQPTRPARGKSRWAGDWEYRDYRGRGPKNYRRSDERLVEEVCERLMDDWRVDASGISVNVSDAEVTLTGTVSSRDEKRRAGECAEDVAGVRNVFNQIRLVNGR